MGKKKSPELTVPELRRLLQIVLPLPVWEVEDALAWLRWQHQRKRVAREAHYKRWLRKYGTCET
jgi:hypothetical protein